MINPEVLDAMLEAGCTAEQIVAAVKAAYAAQEKRMDEKRRKDADRQRRRRHAESRGQAVTIRDITDAPLSPLFPPDKEIPPTPPKEINPPIIPHSPEAGARGFSEFWSAYPNKVGKRDAEKAFHRASKRADLETIMEGLGRYVRKTDDRPWCNPATWLNQDRWQDAPASFQSQVPRQPRNMAEAASQLLDQMRDAENAYSGTETSLGLPETNVPQLALPNWEYEP